MITRIVGLLVIIKLSYGQDIGLTTDASYDIKCTRSSISIVVSKKSYKEWTIKSLQTLDSSCTATDNGTHIYALTPLDKCGTIERKTKGGQLFTNELLIKFTPGADNSVSCSDLRYLFSCFHSDDGTIAPVRPKYAVRCEKPSSSTDVNSIGQSDLSQNNSSFSTNIALSLPGVSLGILESSSSSAYVTRKKIKVCGPVMGKGQHDLKLLLFSDSSYDKPIFDSFITNNDTVEIYYEIISTFNDTELDIGITSCYATPNENPQGQIVYHVVKNGCVMDNTVQFYPSPKRRIRFSVESFKFANNPESKIFMHCNVDVCQVNDAFSKCRRGCNQDYDNRSKRGTEISVIIPRVTPQDVLTECRDGKGRISVKKEFMKESRAENFHLKDRRCQATESDSYYVLYFSVDQCGTQRSNEGPMISFENGVYMKDNRTGKRILIKRLKCFSSAPGVKNTVLTKFRLAKPRRFLVTQSLSPAFTLHFKVNITQDVVSGFATSPIDIDAKFYGRILNIVASGLKNNVSVSIRHCYVKPSTSSAKKITILRNGCVSNRMVLFHEHSADEEGLRIFMNPSVYQPGRRQRMFCSVNVCNQGNPECTQTCGAYAIDDNSEFRLRRRRTNEKFDMSLTCGQKEMTVTLRKATLPQVEAVNLRLNDASCRALENETHFFIAVPLGRCGTKVTQDKDALIYSNEIRQDVPGKVIVRRKLVNIPFRCLYHSTASASSAEFRLKSPTILFGGSAEGIYEVKIRMFKDATFTDERKTVLSLVDPSEDMFFEVAIAIKEPNLVIVLDQCYGKPTGSVNKREKYIFILDGCGVDETVRVYKSPNHGTARFSLRPFQFSSKPISSIYVTCAVSACNPNDPQATCYKDCSK